MARFVMGKIIALLAAIVLIGPWISVSAETRRWPLETVFPDKPGVFFQIYDEALRRGTALPDDASRVEAMGGAVAVRQVVDYLGRASPDELARIFLASQSAFQVTIYGINVMAALYKDRSDGQQLFAAQINQWRGESMKLPGGESLEVSMVETVSISRFIFHKSAQVVHDSRARRPAGQLSAGSYQLETSGICAIEPGPFELSVHESLIEGVRKEMPILLGILGDSEAYLLLPEKIWAKTERDSEHREHATQIQVPAEPVGFYIGRLGQTELRFEDRVRGQCAISIRKIATPGEVR